MSFFGFSFINIISVNQAPPPLGPQVQTTLTNSVSGPAFTERLFQEALKYRKSRPSTPPPRKLTALEAAQLKLQEAEREVRSLPSVFYGHNDSANDEMAHENLNQARENLEREQRAEDFKKALDKARAELRVKIDNARRRH